MGCKLHKDAFVWRLLQLGRPQVCMGLVCIESLPAGLDTDHDEQALAYAYDVVTTLFKRPVNLGGCWRPEPGCPKPQTLNPKA